MLSIIKRKKYLKNYNLISFTIVVLIFTYYFGIATHIFELDFDSEFSYPLKQNIVDCAIALANRKNAVCPIINSYDYNFIIRNENKCKVNEDIRLVLIIKSSINGVSRRRAIRNSWGHESRFSDVVIKRVFLVGVHEGNISINNDIRNEQETYGDIVQADFLDTYFNNSIKTMTGFRWAVENCANSKFYLFSDDDMYVSVKNVLRFIRNPTEYPHYLKKSDNPAVSNFINKRMHYELAETVKLYAGFVFQSAPHRHHCSKWYVSLQEYPYDKWPPYVSAGSYIVSKEALKYMYYASFFTKHFRFDDIYLGLVAKKMGIEPFHSPEFHIFKKSDNFTYVLSSHGFHPDELLKIWNEQKFMGNA